MMKGEEVSFEVPSLSRDVVGHFYFVYILESLSDGSFYVGSTEDLNSRLKEHNNKRSKYSSSKGPWKIVWYGAFVNKLKAYRFERYLKEGSGFAFRNKRLI
jgi:predicted GIY-YIG superfamily endonuclease